MKTVKKKDECLLGIICDLKTPTIAQIQALQSLIGSLSGKISDDEIDLLELTLNSCNYMHHLIEIFSIANKLDVEHLRLNYEKFDLIKLIDEIIFDMKILLKYHNLKIDFPKKDEMLICADKSLIKLVIEHITMFSLNQAFSGSVITVDIRKSRNDIIFEVKSSGFFIEPEILGELFEKEKTKNSIYSQASLGLGMYLCFEIVNAHFGKMIAKSFTNDTNIFGFSIPLC